MAQPSQQLLRQAGAHVPASSFFFVNGRKQPPLLETAVRQCSSCRHGGIRWHVPQCPRPRALPFSGAPYQPLSWELPDDNIEDGQGVDVGLGSLIAGLREERTPAKLLTELKVLRDRLCNDSKALKPKEVMELTFQLRHYMEKVPAYLAQYRNNEQEQKAQVLMLQNLTYPSLTQLCQALARFCWGMEPIDVSGALSLLRQARKLTWLSFKGMVQVATADEGLTSNNPAASTASSVNPNAAAASWALDWSDSPKATATATGAASRLRVGSRGRTPNSLSDWNQEAHRAAAALLPRLQHQTLRLICMGAIPAYTMNSLLAALHGMSMPLTAPQKRRVVAAVLDVMQAKTDPLENVVMLVCMIARLVGTEPVAQHLLPTLAATLEANQQQPRPQSLSFSTCAQLVWLVAQVSLCQEPAHVEPHQIRQQTQQQRQQQSKMEEQQQDEEQAAVAAWHDELSVLQGRRLLSPSDDWPIADSNHDWPQIRLSAGGQAALQAATSNHAKTQSSAQHATTAAHSRWKPRLLGVLQHQISGACQAAQADEHAGMKLQSAGMMVAHWRSAGLPCTPAWACRLAHAIQSTLQQSLGASIKLPTVQLAALLTFADGIASASQDELACLRQFAAAICKQVDQISSHLTDVQLQYVISCMAQLQLAHPQLQLLPALKVPSWVPKMSPQQAGVGWVSTAHGIPILKQRGVQLDVSLEGTSIPTDAGNTAADAGDTAADAGNTAADAGDTAADSELLQRLGAGWLDALRAHVASLQNQEPQGMQGQLGQQDTQVLAFLQYAAAPWSITNTISMSLIMADAIAADCPESLAGSAADPTIQPAGTSQAYADGDKDGTGSPSRTGVKEWAPFLPHYPAWPILLRLLLRHAMAAAVIISDASSANVPPLLGYQRPRQTAMAAQCLARHDDQQAPTLSMQQLLRVEGPPGAVQDSSGSQLVQLLHALCCVPRVPRAILGMETAALAVAIARSVDRMPLYALLAALACMPRLRLRPGSKTFRGSVQARLARCAQAGELRLPSGMLGVLPRVLDMLRTLKQLSMSTGPNLEAVLVHELLEWHLHGEAQPGAAGQDMAALDPALAQGITYSLRLPAGYLQDKELVQLMRLMATLPMPGTQPLLSRMEQLIYIMADSNSIRSKCVAPCITDMCKLGMSIAPPLLARLLRCGLLSWVSRAGFVKEGAQQWQPVLQLYSAHAILVALRGVRYPVGSVAATALTRVWDLVESQRVQSLSMKDSSTDDSISQGAWLRSQGESLMELLQALEVSSGHMAPGQLLLAAPPGQVGLPNLGTDNDVELSDMEQDIEQTGPNSCQTAGGNGNRSVQGQSVGMPDLDALIEGRLAMLKTAAAAGTLPAAPPIKPLAKKKVLPAKALASGSGVEAGSSRSKQAVSRAAAAAAAGGVADGPQDDGNAAAVGAATEGTSTAVEAAQATQAAFTKSARARKAAETVATGKTTRQVVKRVTKAASSGQEGQAVARPRASRSAKSEGKAAASTKETSS